MTVSEFLNLMEKLDITVEGEHSIRSVADFFELVIDDSHLSIIDYEDMQENPDNYEYRCCNFYNDGTIEIMCKKIK